MIDEHQIAFRRLPQDPEGSPFDPITFEAHLHLYSRHDVTRESMAMTHNQDNFKEYVKHMLRKRIIHEVYGDLRKPLNHLMMMAQDNPNANMAEIAKIREQLRGIL